MLWSFMHERMNAAERESLIVRKYKLDPTRRYGKWRYLGCLRIKKGDDGAKQSSTTFVFECVECGRRRRAGFEDMKKSPEEVRCITCMSSCKLGQEFGSWKVIDPTPTDTGRGKLEVKVQCTKCGHRRMHILNVLKSMQTQQCRECRISSCWWRGKYRAKTGGVK